MGARYLINDNGEPFGAEELDALATELDVLKDEQRVDFRNENAQAIAIHAAERMLIVAGPGTGKSTLFKQRILYWLEGENTARILALSFVRKLVADLNVDIQSDTKLTDAQKKQVDVFTLHKYARSIVERNHGTEEWPFAPHFRIIGQEWKLIVWDDVLSMNGHQGEAKYNWKEFETQLHNNEFAGSEEWKALKDAYFTLCQFYNAAGFPDLILRARDALVEDPALNEPQFFIFDEYQDFNAAEEELLEQLTDKSRGTLIVGDDDQVLYEKLKSGKASLIRSIYKDASSANAMLPFCSRCDFHIAHAASHFIKQSADPDCIKKIYLPLSDAKGSQAVQIVACAAPSAAVDYIRKFVEEHKTDIDKRKADLAAGKEKDAYLLILSPSKAVDFYKLNDARDELFTLLAPYRADSKKYSDGYYIVLNYYSLAKYPTNNFTFRNVLYHEGIPNDNLLALLTESFSEGKSFSEMNNDFVRRALDKAKTVRDILDSGKSILEKVEALAEHIYIKDAGALQRDLEAAVIDPERVEAIEHQNEEEAELEELQIKKMSAVELMTIVGSKGLSADHVIVIGFDNINMSYITRNAFYVAKTRARRSLHVLTALKAGGAARPHPFLNDLPDQHLVFSKYMKGERKQITFPGGRAEFTQYLASLNRQTRRRN